MTLARRGFRDGARAASVLAGLPGIPDDVIDRVAAAASPDVALEALSALAGVMGAQALWDALSDEGLRERMILILGTSEALGEFLVRHPDAVDELRAASDKPHTRDELYVVVAGRGAFVCEGERKAVGCGDALFVPAGAVHRFEDFSDDLAVWVMFYGAEGGEATSGA